MSDSRVSAGFVQSTFIAGDSSHLRINFSKNLGNKLIPQSTVSTVTCPAPIFHSWQFGACLGLLSLLLVVIFVFFQTGEAQLMLEILAWCERAMISRCKSIRTVFFSVCRISTVTFQEDLPGRLQPRRTSKRYFRRK